MLRPTLSAAFALSVVTLVPEPFAAPHDDDPKVLDRRAPVTGPGYRRAVHGALESSSSGPVFPAQGVRLESWLTLDELGDGLSSGNDCWGYVSPSGREYALMGTNGATVVVEITNPANAQVVGRIDGTGSLWRDIKVYQDRAYSVTEGTGGIQVINLSQVDAGIVTLENTITGQGTNATHNVAIDEESGFLYRCGGQGNGLRFYSLANPGSPQYVGSWQSRYVHDAQIVTYTSGPMNGRQIAFCCGGFGNGSSDTRLSIVDVTNKNNPQTLRHIAYPNRRYSHQGWLSVDRTRFYLGDELDQNAGIAETVTRVFDVTNPAQASFLGEFDNGVEAVSHNMYTRDEYLFQANYTSGLRVFDVGANPDSPEEVAYLDTAPDLHSQTFNGLWSCFADFPSGTVIGSDLERGLFVMTVDPLDLDVDTTALATLDSSGESVQVMVSEFTPGSLDASAVTLVIDAGDGPLQIPMTPGAVAGGFTADIPSFVCGTEVEWYVSARTMNGVESTFPAAAPAAPFVSIVADAITTVRYDDMQQENGWVGGQPGDTAARGQWELGIPIGTDAEPIGGNLGNGRKCWFTEQAAIANNIEGDVDGGFTTLMSPVLDMSTLEFPRVEYYRWYSNGVGINPRDDAFVIDVSNDGGATWTNLETLGPHGPGTDPGWVRASHLIAETIVPTSQMRFRFIASDTGLANVVEAALDDFRIIDSPCDDPVGTEYCMANPNSTGNAGTIAAEGTAFIVLNDLELVASNLPQSQTGFFVVSRDQIFVPNVGGSQGNLCVGGDIGRYLGQVGNTGATGELRLEVDVAAIPQPTVIVPTLPGDTWNFQCWHRDANPNGTSNFTRGYSVMFR